MSGKQRGGGNAAGRAVAALAGAGAAFAVRKLLALGWKKITGKEPPDHPDDPQVKLVEALLWGALTGAGVGAARMLASRVAAPRAAAVPDDEAEHL